MMEVTVLTGTFKATETFVSEVYRQFLCLHAWPVLSHSLLTLGAYVDRCVAFPNHV